MSVAEARSRLAALDIRPWDDATINAELLAMSAEFLRASPQVTAAPSIAHTKTGASAESSTATADTGSGWTGRGIGRKRETSATNTSIGTWFIGASGFDATGGENELALTLLRIVRAVHPNARVAIADTCVAAHAATWTQRKSKSSDTSNNDVTRNNAIVIVPPGECANYLASAPLGLIPMDTDFRDSLHALGLHTVGAFAALDASDVERRWGTDGIRAWRLAKGDDPRRPGLVRTETERSAAIELPAPAESSATVIFAVSALLERLIRELVADGRAAAAVAITLVLDSGAGRKHTLVAGPQRTLTREVRPARPCARFDLLFNQCRSLLERWVAPAPVTGVILTVPATAPLAADQGDLLVASWRDTAAQAEAVFSRLRTALDPSHSGDVVVYPTLNDSQRPEHSASWTSVDSTELAKPDNESLQRRTLQRPLTLIASSTQRSSEFHIELEPVKLEPVMRLLPSPEAIEVEERPAPGHPTPHAMWRNGRKLLFTHIDGPERLSGDWWRSDSYARDYWRCTTDSDGELLIYRDQKQWFLQGWYD